MSPTNSSTHTEAQKSTALTTTTYTFSFAVNTELKGVKEVAVRGQMRELSPFQRAKLLSSAGRVCIAYRDGAQLLVLEQDVNSDILYHYCPHFRSFYTCCKETGPTIVLPNTVQFNLVSALGVNWAIGSFMHEIAEGTRSFVKQYIPQHPDPKQLFHAAATFRAFGLPRFAQDLVAPNNGVIVRFLKQKAWNIKSPRAVGRWLRSLKRDTLICQDDQALLVEAHKIFARRIEGYNRTKVENSNSF